MEKIIFPWTLQSKRSELQILASNIFDQLRLRAFFIVSQDIYCIKAKEMLLSEGKLKKEIIEEIFMKLGKIQFIDKLQELLTTKNTFLSIGNSLLGFDKVIFVVLGQLANLSIEETLGTYSEVTYELDKPEGANNKFKDYLEEYVKKEDEEETTKQLPDE